MKIQAQVIQMAQKMSKNEIKQATRQKIRDFFNTNGCTIDEKKAGSVDYEAIGISGSNQRIGAIYGSRGGACAIWVKEEVWESLQADSRYIHLFSKESGRKVTDVKMFARGFQWAIHFSGLDDDAIIPVCEAALNVGSGRWERTQKRRATELRRATERVEREAKMAEKRRDPWS